MLVNNESELSNQESDEEFIMQIIS